MARARAATSAARRLTYKPHGPPPWSTSTRLPRTWPPSPPERPPGGPKDRPPQPNAHDNHADRASARASTSTERPRRHFFRTLLAARCAEADAGAARAIGGGRPVGIVVA